MQKLVAMLLVLAVLGAEGKERKAKAPKASSADGEAASESKAAGAVEPLVSVELFTRTYEFFGDFRKALATSGAYAQFTEWRESKGIAALDLSKVDVLQSIEDKAKHHGLHIPKAEVVKHISTVQEHANKVTTLALDSSAGTRAQIFQHVESKAKDFVDEFESFLPQYKGFISRHPADFLLFMLYMFVVVFSLYRICWGLLKLSLRIVCLFLCCGLCCRSKSSGPKKGGNKGKAPAAKAVAKAPAAKAESGKKKK